MYLSVLYSQSAVQDASKLLCVLLDKLNSSNEDFDKSVFEIILAGAGSLLSREYFIFPQKF